MNALRIFSIVALVVLLVGLAFCSGEVVALQSLPPLSQVCAGSTV